MEFNIVKRSKTSTNFVIQTREEGGEFETLYAEFKLSTVPFSFTTFEKAFKFILDHFEFNEFSEITIQAK